MSYPEIRYDLCMLEKHLDPLEENTWFLNSAEQVHFGRMYYKKVTRSPVESQVVQDVAQVTRPMLISPVSQEDFSDEGDEISDITDEGDDDHSSVIASDREESSDLSGSGASD